MLCLATSAAASGQKPAADPIDPAVVALLGRIAQGGPSKTSFTEVRYSRLMKRPVITAGTLEYRGSTALEKSITKPYRETTTVDGENVRILREGETPRRFGLKRAPELKGVLTSFGALLAGDAKTLSQHFTTKLTGDDARWQLALVPRDAKTRERVASIAIDGAADRPTCFSMREPDGDESITLLGEVAKADLGKTPPRDAVAKACTAR